MADMDGDVEVHSFHEDESYEGRPSDSAPDSNGPGAVDLQEPTTVPGEVQVIVKDEQEKPKKNRWDKYFDCISRFKSKVQVPLSAILAHPFFQRLKSYLSRFKSKVQVLLRAILGHPFFQRTKREIFVDFAVYGVGPCVWIGTLLFYATYSSKILRGGRPDSYRVVPITYFFSMGATLFWMGMIHLFTASKSSLSAMVYSGILIILLLVSMFTYYMFVGGYRIHSAFFILYLMTKLYQLGTVWDHLRFQSEFVHEVYSWLIPHLKKHWRMGIILLPLSLIQFSMLFMGLAFFTASRDVKGIVALYFYLVLTSVLKNIYTYTSVSMTIRSLAEEEDVEFKGIARTAFRSTTLNLCWIIFATLFVVLCPFLQFIWTVSLIMAKIDKKLSKGGESGEGHAMGSFEKLIGVLLLPVGFGALWSSKATRIICSILMPVTSKFVLAYMAAFDVHWFQSFNELRKLRSKMMAGSFFDGQQEYATSSDNINNNIFVNLVGFGCTIVGASSGLIMRATLGVDLMYFAFIMGYMTSRLLSEFLEAPYLAIEIGYLGASVLVHNDKNLERIYGSLGRDTTKSPPCTARQTTMKLRWHPQGVMLSLELRTLKASEWPTEPPPPPCRA